VRIHHHSTRKDSKNKGTTLQKSACGTDAMIQKGYMDVQKTT